MSGFGGGGGGVWFWRKRLRINVRIFCQILRNIAGVWGVVFGMIIAPINATD